jgi:hypothetical protein
MPVLSLSKRTVGVQFDMNLVTAFGRFSATPRGDFQKKLAPRRVTPWLEGGDAVILKRPLPQVRPRFPRNSLNPQDVPRD